MPVCLFLSMLMPLTKCALLCRKGDIYVHAELHGASTTIIKNHQPDAPIPPLTISQVSSPLLYCVQELCAHVSSMRVQTLVKLQSGLFDLWLVRFPGWHGLRMPQSSLGCKDCHLGVVGAP